MPGYGSGPQFWDARYLKENKPYDWLQSYEDLKKIFTQFTKGNKETVILNVGCGSSLLAEEMYDDGYRHIVNIDNAAVCIEQMSKRNKEVRPELEWIVMDAFAMDFECAKFDLVIDKSTLDAFACGDNSSENVHRFLQGVNRVMKDTGVYLCITFGTPDTRSSYFEKVNFDVHIIKAPVPYDNTTFHYVYACCKGKGKISSIHEGDIPALSIDRCHGHVERYDRRRGFGLIKPSDKPDGECVFVHWKEISTTDSWPALEQGMDVEYDLGNDETGRTVARRVTFFDGAKVAAGSELRHLSDFTVNGTVKYWSYKGFGFIKTDAPIAWPKLLPAGSSVYFSREDIMTYQHSAASVIPGQRVRFKVYKPQGDENDEVAAAEVRIQGGAMLEAAQAQWKNGGAQAWTKGSFTMARPPMAWKQLGVQKTIVKPQAFFKGTNFLGINPGQKTWW